MSLALVLPLLFVVGVVCYRLGYRARGRNRLMPPDERNVVRNWQIKGRT